MEIVTVSASKTYNILIGRGLLGEAGARIAAVHKPCTAAVVAGSNVAPLYAKTVCASLEAAGFRTLLFVFPAGEQSKCFATYEKLLEFLAEHHLTRSDLLVALGGGVTGDLTGFTAATYLRGIPYVQIPTTLLAAVDSSVGGKTAIDLTVGKNLVGAFWQPILVLCDPDTLSTLPEEIFRAGCAEVIKYGILGNREFFDELAASPVKEQIEHVIKVCVSMKRDIVAEDEFDTGLRKLLNLGHSFGHAVEGKSGFTISHGYSVAIGTAIIARAAAAKGILSDEDLNSILNILTAYDLPTESPYGVEDLFEIALSDKKMSGSTLSLVVPDRIGHCRIMDVPAAELTEWLKAGGVR